MARRRKKDEDEDKTYKVKDKRRVNPDGSLKEEAAEATPAQSTQEIPQAEAPPAEPQAKTTAQEPAAEEPTAETPREQAELPPPDVYAMLGFVTGLLADTAWQLMGIRLMPGQKEVVKDLAQAKIAIDTIVFIADKLHTKLSEEERKSIRNLISDLQINYVRLAG